MFSTYRLLLLIMNLRATQFIKSWRVSYFTKFFSKSSPKYRLNHLISIDTLNTFYLRLYGIIHMVNDHSESKRKNPLPPHELLFSISSKGSFICIIPQTGYHIPQPLLHQSWSTGWNEKYLNGSTMVKKKKTFLLKSSTTR